MKGGNEATRNISREVRKVREVLKIALRSLRSLRLKYFGGLTSAIQIDYWLRKRFSAERGDFVRRSGECIIPFVSLTLLPPSNQSTQPRLSPGLWTRRRLGGAALHVSGAKLFSTILAFCFFLKNLKKFPYCPLAKNALFW